VKPGLARLSGSHDRTAELVESGQYEVGVLNDQVFSSLGLAWLWRWNESVGRDSMTPRKRAGWKELTAGHPPRRMAAYGSTAAQQKDNSGSVTVVHLGERT
jgi:hypothetical protein